jgi:NADPH:quinone reductase-like Zn-dependent oxidoreductase
MQNRSIVITHPGGLEVLKLVEEPIPEPNPEEVRVKVLAAGVARADILMRTGQYPGPVPAYPYAPGYDIVGVIDSLGEGASKFRPGKNVLALTGIGGYTEYLCLPEADLVPVPKDFDPAEAVCLGLNYLTAYQMLHRSAKVKAGERVLFHAAGSGVGTAQLQLGNLVNLEMYGTASRSKHEVVTELGGIAIDYQHEDFVKRIRALTGDGVDAVFDPVGGSHLWRSFRTLRNNGHLIPYGEMAITGVQNPNPLEKLLHNYLPSLLNSFPGRTVKWYEALDDKVAHPDWYHDDMKMLVSLLAEGKIKPVIARRLPLVEAVRAHELLEKSEVAGKIVLQCN